MSAHSENNDKRIHQQVQKRLAAGEKANRLINEQSPFYAGTYFPPKSAPNRPGFKDLLTTIHKVWIERRGGQQDFARPATAYSGRTNCNFYRK